MLKQPDVWLRVLLFSQVHLQKQIPAQAGMGGGSGNAATALFAANELMGCPASPQDLELWSAELGSDITFFLSEGSCYCTGRGEVLHPQPAMEPCE
jgi:4-diphosphocytidyl-2-C-methyl-D-erythritol kinase